ncbi:hypothetical protein STTU_5275 [Streptomyces sp. Tu6071]|nr:hypothetical protein STTU_5275 [Streptomyces sp. Tu6071]
MSTATDGPRPARTAQWCTDRGLPPRTAGTGRRNGAVGSLAQERPLPRRCTGTRNRA